MPNARRLKKLVSRLIIALVLLLAAKLATEALVNGGCNYNGPKVA